MKQSTQAETHKQKWLRIAFFICGLASLTIAATTMMGQPAAGAQNPNAEAITPVELTPFYDDSPSWNSGREWQQVPRGSSVLGGVPFEINGLLRLSSLTTKNEGKAYRDEIEGIPVGRKFARLHVLHIVSSATEAESPYARILLRYADGTTTSLALIYGHHAREWRRPKYENPSTISDPNSKLVWRSETDAASGITLRLFKTTFVNPKQEAEVTEIDLSSGNIMPSATILAMSIGPANLPIPADDPPSLPEPVTVYEGQMKFTAVDAESGRPVANVKLKITGTETGGGTFRPPNTLTDTNGECLVQHPGDSTASLAVLTYGDGVPSKTIWWQGKRMGQPIPSAYTFRFERAVTIGGVIQDESGQPVNGAAVSIEQVPSSSGRNGLEQLALEHIEPKTDGQGHWVFRSLPKNFGDFMLTISHPDLVETRFLSDVLASNYSRPGSNIISLHSLLATNAVTKVRQGLSISGRVLTDKGKPIVGANVLLREARSVKKPNQTRTDEHGAFRLSGAAAGSAHLVVQASGYSPQLRPFPVEAKTQPFEFQLAPGHVFIAKVYRRA